MRRKREYREYAKHVKTVSDEEVLSFYQGCPFIAHTSRTLHVAPKRVRQIIREGGLA